MYGYCFGRENRGLRCLNGHGEHLDPAKEACRDELREGAFRGDGEVFQGDGSEMRVFEEMGLDRKVSKEIDLEDGMDESPGSEIESFVLAG